MHFKCTFNNILILLFHVYISGVGTHTSLPCIIVCLVRVQRNRKKVVDPENYRSSNLISDDCREGVLGQIPGLNPASFRLEHLS